MNTDALRELRKMVAAGAFPGDIFGSSFGPNIAILTPYEAFSGSLDAAKALHEALLPGWDINISMSPCSEGWETAINIWNGQMAPDSREVVILDDEAENPARAWLLAILDALIAKEADNG